MPNQMNMYRGRIKEIKETIDKINECIIAYKLNDEGIREIAIYQGEKAELIRDEVANRQGKVEVLLKGLEKDSPKKKNYEELLNNLNSFMELFK